jgi:hypothetical protein
VIARQEHDRDESSGKRVYVSVFEHVYAISIELSVEELALVATAVRARIPAPRKRDVIACEQPK